jgi:hypothetical protein
MNDEYYKESWRWVRFHRFFLNLYEKFRELLILIKFWYLLFFIKTLSDNILFHDTKCMLMNIRIFRWLICFLGDSLEWVRR